MQQERRRKTKLPAERIQDGGVKVLEVDVGGLQDNNQNPQMSWLVHLKPALRIEELVDSLLGGIPVRGEGKRGARGAGGARWARREVGDREGRGEVGDREGRGEGGDREGRGEGGEGGEERGEGRGGRGVRGVRARGERAEGRGEGRGRLRGRQILMPPAPPHRPPRIPESLRRGHLRSGPPPARRRSAVGADRSRSSG